MQKLLFLELFLNFIWLCLSKIVQYPGCGVPRGLARATDGQSRIINGDLADSTAYPWLVSLRLLTNAHFCVGALVAPNFVLTAGHFVQFLNSQQFFIVAGKPNLRDTLYPQDIVYVSKIYTHPKYTAHLPRGYDLALLKLNQSVNYSPICLPDSADDANRIFDSISVVAGWLA